MFGKPPASSPSPAPAAASPSPLPPSAAAPSEEANETPTLALDPAKAAEVKGDHQCQPGDKYTATVTLEVQSVGDDGSVTFGVPDIQDFTPVDQANAESDYGPEAPAPSDGLDGEKMLGFKRPAGPTRLKNVAASLRD
jgi:hypothetical protein